MPVRYLSQLPQSKYEWLLAALVSEARFESRRGNRQYFYKRAFKPQTILLRLQVTAGSNVGPLLCLDTSLLLVASIDPSTSYSRKLAG